MHARKEDGVALWLRFFLRFFSSLVSFSHGTRVHTKSLRGLKELVEGAVREQMTRGSLESVGDVEAEVEAQCATLCRRIGDEVAKSAM